MRMQMQMRMRMRVQMRMRMWMWMWMRMARSSHAVSRSANGRGGRRITPAYILEQAAQALHAPGL